ncbi:quinolinate synthase NadA [Tenacibaculum finnmarkense genomovar finnmarkense]|uniref:quinolinate synthase NadA n=1 Tax=Tenacibaculum finnmarkense TaxID=2781243 RepID=UPI001E5C0D67|nr:quinolinate synthase NadA [Tenacibaculum finnmarkense]MCD8416972.1 quinolinate synthase NadA [Tenacibaculum finnmarkense genomovar finnmarkense]MCD8447182.1 quinolinate synthase NadA [Tenacibaculum finnmarkense genomovar finnmarkense]MCD8454151.1 quinolinate synthase NadA [Tenacibaculum finnmarkense genomovar ulcerans]MCG8201773.1 quinolinate synthase NadA [Tenacibaculum finnmarkense genomovar finnmarkense]MCG8209478.1 quinolinate synthase NadA [Tenacibaculum finnmarkense genomovar finnmark
MKLKQTLKEKITALKNKKNAIILAHYYQDTEIQDIADYVGDSLGLSQKAAETTADIIVFAGVHFMAETAKILNPTKKVVLPDLNAGCSLAESCPADSFEKFVKKHPNHTVVTYVNCSAEVKALTDIVCTSSNALKIVESIPAETPIIFAPDRNLGNYIMQETGREMLLWDGSCVVHEAFSLDKLAELCQKYPDYKIIAHPESEEHILKTATYVGSTAGMIKYVKEHPTGKFIVATEVGILHKMKQEVPTAELIPAPVKEDTTCACSECAYMKVNTMQKLYDCLATESPIIEVDKTIRERALIPIQRMLDISK